MATYLGAFPFPSQAPAIMTFDALVRVVVILTERYRTVLKRGRRDWLREIYRSVAVYDRRASRSMSDARLENLEGLGIKPTQGSSEGSNQGFAIDQAIEDEGGADEEDELILAAFESMDAVDAFRYGEKSDVHHSIIPTDNFRKLVQLMLLIAPLEEQDDLATYFTQLTPERLEALRRTSDCIISSFDVESSPGITYRTFDKLSSSALPHLFDGFNALFSHFLFAKDLDLSKRKASTSSVIDETPKPTPSKVSNEPPLATPGDILDLDLLSQLSFFLPPNTLFRRLRPLYSGSNHGFSMGSFEKKVFNWRAPTIILISGSILDPDSHDPQSRIFLETLPPARYPSSLPPSSDEETDRTVVYGAYINQPWKQTHKAPFGDPETILFTLSPRHTVFRAIPQGTDFVSFSPSRTNSNLPGISLGTSIPARKKELLSLGPVSLHLDDGLEFGVFTHLKTGGGSFDPSPWLSEFQDRFTITDIEVWGCGGDEEAERQRAAWKWEEAEAERRRRINLGGTGDIDADKELLRMAGLIGGDRSGGSMG